MQYPLQLQGIQHLRHLTLTLVVRINSRTLQSSALWLSHLVLLQSPLASPLSPQSRPPSLPQLAFRRLSLRLQINILCNALPVARCGSQCQAGCMWHAFDTTHWECNGDSDGDGDCDTFACSAKLLYLRLIVKSNICTMCAASTKGKGRRVGRGRCDCYWCWNNTWAPLTVAHLAFVCRLNKYSLRSDSHSRRERGKGER